MGIDTGGGGFSGSSAASGDDGSHFGDMNYKVGAQAMDNKVLLFLAIAAFAVVMLKR